MTRISDDNDQARQLRQRLGQGGLDSRAAYHEAVLALLDDRDEILAKMEQQASALQELRADKAKRSRLPEWLDDVSYLIMLWYVMFLNAELGHHQAGMFWFVLALVTSMCFFVYAVVRYRPVALGASGVAVCVAVVAFVRHW